MNSDLFLGYLEQRWRAFVEDEGNVPCGSCRGCCRAGYAIGLAPSEALAIPDHSVIDGHAVILPLPDGSCPYLVDDLCAIYEKRPVSCRQFDCRDFALSAVKINAELGAENQEHGVAEINASIERFVAENGGLSSTPMATMARDLVGKGSSAVAAAQNAMVMTLLEALPRAKGQQVIDRLLGSDENARGAAMRAYDQLRETQRGESS